MKEQWITIGALDAWPEKESRRAQEILPKLVSKLLLVSCDEINRHQFPYDKGIESGGYDGFLETETKSSHFPKGTSVWEFGTSKNIIKKFNEDYEKRSTESTEINRSETSFCFVSLRIWNHKKSRAELIEEKKKEGIWKDIYIFDATNLVNWLDENPSVTVWLLNEMGVDLRGVLTAEMYWDTIVGDTKPKLNREFFLKDRKPIVPQIQSYLKGGARRILLAGESSIEAMLIFIAELKEETDDEKEMLLSKCLIVEKEEILEKLSALNKECIIIPTFGQLSNLKSYNSNFKFVFPVNTGSPISSLMNDKVKIESRTFEQFENALSELGYQGDEPFRLTSEVKRSFPAFLRKITTNPSIKNPKWITTSNKLFELLPALLVCGWDESKKGDREVISELSGMKYEQYIQSIQPYLSSDDAPITKIDNMYMCVSPTETWAVIGQYLNLELYKRYEKIIEKVYLRVLLKGLNYHTEDIEQSDESRRGINKYEFSKDLLEGLVITIYMIEKWSEVINSNTITNGRSLLIRKIMSNIQSSDDWKKMIGCFNLFVEASPEEVLVKLEREINAPASEIWCLFEEPNDFGARTYTNILWVLEKLTWDKKYISRAITLLFAIGEKNFVYSGGNSPLDSLKNILCLGLSNSILNATQKKSLIIRMFSDYPQTTKKIIGEILSDRSATFFGVAKYRYRSIDVSPVSETIKDLITASNNLTEFYLEKIEGSYSDWSFVLDHIVAFTPHVDELVKKCIDQADSMSKIDLQKLISKLVDTIGKHRKFMNSDWSIEEKYLTKLEELFKRILPNDASKYIHYFSYGFLGLNPTPFNEEEYDSKEERDKFNSLKKSKIKELIECYGEKGILEILPYVDEKQLLVDEAIELIYENHFNWNFISEIKEMDELRARSAIHKIYHENQLNDFKTQIRTLEDKDITWLLTCLPVTNEVFSFIELQSDNIQEDYWRVMDPHKIVDKEEGFQDYLVKEKCVNKLLEINRPYTLINYLSIHQYPINTNTLINIMQKAANLKPECEISGIEYREVASYNIVKMFEKLDNIEETFFTVMVQLEAAFFEELYWSHKKLKYLPTAILSTPEQYIEFLFTAYGEDEKIIARTDEENNRASIIDSLLGALDRLPRSTNDNLEPIEKEFHEWMKSADELAKNRNCMKKHYAFIGKLLSFSPTKDDQWPINCVCEYLEKKKSDIIDSAFITGKLNQRGGFTGTAGIAEQKIASQFYDYADKLDFLYPYTAGVVRKIGKDYESDSHNYRNRALKGYY